MKIKRLASTLVAVSACTGTALSWPFHHRIHSAGRSQNLGVAGHGDKHGVSQPGANALLPVAASHRDIEAVRSSLTAGADINAADARGMTPLMLAAKEGDAKIVKLLLRNHANTTLRDARGWTALKWAKKTHNYESAIMIALAASQQ